MLGELAGRSSRARRRVRARGRDEHLQDVDPAQIGEVDRPLRLAVGDLAAAAGARGKERSGRFTSATWK
eukprot:9745992-Alexandrium_andersonii.AAC.1